MLWTERRPGSTYTVTGVPKDALFYGKGNSKQDGDLAFLERFAKTTAMDRLFPFTPTSFSLR